MDWRVITNFVLILLSPAMAYAASFPTWSDQINTSGRFKVLTEFGNQAVLDRETGIVWAKIAGDVTGDGNVNASDRKTWLLAHDHCNNKVVGNRKGWRLPTIQELASLIDPSVSSPGPTLPPGHPFTNVQHGGGSDLYWSATASLEDPGFSAWVADFQVGLVYIDKIAHTDFVWCVRGTSGVDSQ